MVKTFGSIYNESLPTKIRNVQENGVREAHEVPTRQGGAPSKGGRALNSRLRFFAGKLLSKWEGPYVIEEVYHSGAMKINNFEGTNPRVVNGQRIKHYISGNPINAETNIIETVTPEEYIRDTFQNVPDSEKE